MQKAIEILEAIKADYKSQGKLLQAHVIHNAIQTIMKFDRRLKSNER